MVQVTVDQSKLAALALRLEKEEDGKALKRDLARNLREAVRPAVDEIKAGAEKIKSGSRSSVRPTKKKPMAESAISLGAAIARSINVSVRTKGRSADVRIGARKSGMPRGFTNAPKRVNAQSWRHPVYGDRDVWVAQVGNPRFFDDPPRREHERYRRACVKAMDDMANRIAKR